MLDEAKQIVSVPGMLVVALADVDAARLHDAGLPRPGEVARAGEQLRQVCESSEVALNGGAVGPS